MNAGHLAAKMRKMREDHEDAEMENGELNLVPYLDIVTNVIMFLMMTTTFSAALADINVSVPTMGPSNPSPTDTPPPERELNLTVSISDKGFTIAASGGVLYENDIMGRLPTLPKIKTDSGDKYDYAGLTKKMREIKEAPQNAAEGETKAIINANSDITYEVVVATMDAIRGDGSKVLFPDVLLSAGVN